jgi:hypothetical protein
VPALNGSCSCPPMSRDLGPNPARYIGPCRPDTKIFRVVPCLGRAFFFRASGRPIRPDPNVHLYSWPRALLVYQFYTLQRLYPVPTSRVVSTELARPLDTTNVNDLGSTTRPLQSSTSFRKPATVSRKSNAGISRLTVIAAKSTRKPPYTPTPLLPLPLSGKVVLHKLS